MSSESSRAATRRRSATIDGVDYRLKTTMPVRDMWRDGEIVFLVDIYGWTGRDVCVIPGGSEPMMHAVRRLGLDPLRYQAIIWDIAGIV